MPAQRLRTGPLTAAQWVWLLAALCGIVHLLQLAPDLEDIDSINFALGLRDFDPARHQPHPPGYPVYILLGRVALALLRTMASSLPRTVLEAHALALWSALGAAVAVVGLARLRGELTRAGASARDTVGSAAGVWSAVLMAANALFWISGSRPLSDMPGLGLALLAQSAILSALPGPDGVDRGVRRIVLGAGLAGLAIGLRTQTLWLTGPLLLGVLVLQPRGVRLRGWAAGLGAGAVACLLWAVPMVVATGGLSAYLAALGSQAGEDFAFVDMVYAHPSAKAVSLALYRTFVLPWGVDLRAPGLPPGGRLAVQLVLATALLGVLRLVLRAPRRLAWTALAFVPYLVFHVVFQETVTVRYALPAVPLVALLVVEGACWLGRAAPAAVAVGAVWALTLALPHTAVYAASPNGAMQAVAAMGRVAESTPPVILTTHIVLTRSAQAANVPGVGLLPPRLSGNWLALADYWVGGGTEPVWFLADPKRFDLDSIDADARRDVTRFTWPAAVFPELGGVRPTVADWYRLKPPAWVVGEGWSLSPETGGVTAATGAGPFLRPVRAHVRRVPGAVRLMLGGRLFAPADHAPVPVRVTVDGRLLEAWDVAALPGTFLRFIELPAGALLGEGLYAAVTVSATQPAGVAPAPLALTQFRAGPASAVSWGFAEGWHDDEVDVAAATRFRWSSGEAGIAVRGGEGDIRVRVEADAPRKNFREAPEVTLRAGGQVLATAHPLDAFTIEGVVPASVLAASGGQITVTTSRTFSPAERAGSPDQRRLGLRVLRVHVAPADATVR